ncbi:YbjN domain-containing protein [Kordiimonas gwangyangensis]|nr:YbjN domain-containing protein [Kordiimonas gwangyangensis]
MTTTLSTGHSEVLSHNPVDLAEELAGANDWPVERHGEDELTMFISGQYTDLQFRVFWREDFKTLQFACLFDLRVPEGRRSDIYHTIG